MHLTFVAYSKICKLRVTLLFDLRLLTTGAARLQVTIERLLVIDLVEI